MASTLCTKKPWALFPRPTGPRPFVVLCDDKLTSVVSPIKSTWLRCSASDRVWIQCGIMICSWVIASLLRNRYVPCVSAQLRMLLGKETEGFSPFTGRYFEKRASQETDQSAKMKDQEDFIK